ncbi:MAG: hypothetical protein ABIU63_05490 [Chitinophagaceae bacterium]
MQFKNNVINILWVLIGINTIALIVFIAAYFVLNAGKNVDYQEKGWTFILSALGLLVILLAAVPLRLSHSTGSLIVAGFFALLPLSIFIAKKLPSFKKQKTFAQTYYKDKQQRSIAEAIEKNDTASLARLIKGQDLSVQGTRVWDWDGLNYLQFAVRLRTNPISFPFDVVANTAAIHLLVKSGSPVTPALAEACRYLPEELITFLLDAGADPNCRGFVNPNSLLFDLIQDDAISNQIRILLINRGADVNGLSDEKLTPVMYAAHQAGIREYRAGNWELVRYLLEEAHADYRYTNPKGLNLAGIIADIKKNAIDRQIVMPQNFHAVVDWLNKMHAAPER